MFRTFDPSLTQGVVEYESRPAVFTRFSKLPGMASETTDLFGIDSRNVCGGQIPKYQLGELLIIKYFPSIQGSLPLTLFLSL